MEDYTPISFLQERNKAADLAGRQMEELLKQINP
jgi:hypothetical protein